MSKIKISHAENGKWVTTDKTTFLADINVVDNDLFYFVRVYAVCGLSAGGVGANQFLLFKYGNDEESSLCEKLISQLTQSIYKFKRVDSFHSEHFKSQVYFHTHGYWEEDIVKAFVENLKYLGYTNTWGITWELEI